MLRNGISLPRIYPIIDDSSVSFDRIEDVSKAIIKGGAKILQLRSKRFSSKEFLEAARIIREIARNKGVFFIVNDRVDVAILADADGVHLGQDDLTVTEARKLLGKDKIIGYSTHNLREASEAIRLPVDYISFGPIFPTKTKKDAKIPKGLKGLAEVKKAVGIPIVAIGGITETNMIHVFQEGADSVAMISEILTTSDISQKLKRLIAFAKDLRTDSQ